VFVHRSNFEQTNCKHWLFLHFAMQMFCLGKFKLILHVSSPPLLSLKICSRCV
jgi:hypothetical protein